MTNLNKGLVCLLALFSLTIAACSKGFIANEDFTAPLTSHRPDSMGVNPPPAQPPTAPPPAPLSSGLVAGSPYMKAYERIQPRLNRKRVLNRAFGTAHVNPRYNPAPNADRSTVFVDGAIDAYNEGFEILKIWNGPEVRTTWTNNGSSANFYGLPASNLPQFTDFASALDNEYYQTVLSIPFKTVVFTADDIEFWDLESKILTEADKERIYRQTYQFAIRLLRDFKGTGRTFIIQNHEGDWHLLPRGVPAGKDAPYPIETPGQDNALQNVTAYLSLRQSAIEKARKDVASDVSVYHLCEVVRVLDSADPLKQAPSIARNVLKYVTCDLVGYSAWESLDHPDSSKFDLAMDYLRKNSRPSPVFQNHIVVSEIGAPERKHPERINTVTRIIQKSLSQQMPFVLFWNLYDNECASLTGAACNSLDRELAESELAGFYIKKPNGDYGQIFSQLLPGLTLPVPSPTLQPQVTVSPPPAVSGDLRTQQIHDCYRTYLGRSPDPEGLAYWLSQPGDFPALCAAYIQNSPEAQIRQCYLANLNREPDREGMNYWLSVYQGGNVTIPQICSSIR